MRSKLVTAIAAIAALASGSGLPQRAAAEVPNAIAAGGSHSCAITPGGEFLCWGYNGSGQLGDGTLDDHSTPQGVIGLDGAAVAVATGTSHTCAITSAGGVACWGANGSGQLGDGSTTDHDTPVDVVGLSSGVLAVSAGGSHTCAITSSDGVRCWGANGSGQLGDGTTTSHSTPVDVIGLSSGVVAVATGGSHTCAFTNTGSLKCWGDNSFGQLGNGTTVDTPVPVDVLGLSVGVTAIAAGGSHTCAITSLPNAGDLKCWGYNILGQVGDGSTTNRSTPVDVSGLSSGVTAVSAGYAYTCALANSLDFLCWGSNGSGQLGDGTTTTRHTPVEVVEVSGGAWAITTGGAHTCAVSYAGAVCWGADSVGQLGDGRQRVNPTAVAVSGASGASAVAAGEYHSCAITAAGGVQCWGHNYYGQLGDGTTADHNAPQDVVGLSSGVVAIAAGSDHTCALTSTGDVRCWGTSEYGQVGNGAWTGQSTPALVGLSGPATAIAAGDRHSCAVVNAGGLQCWGANPYGALGDGTTDSHNTPQNVIGLASSAVGGAAGGRHTCALTSAGGVQCWGRNEWGELGDGSTVDHSAPADVSGLTSGVAAITAGYFHTCARTSADALRCWGRNLSGQLGDGTTTNHSSPTGVTGFASGALAVATGGGGTHTCAITSAGGARCWGANSTGEVGDGTTTNRSAPANVVGLSSGVSAIGPGHGHTCAVVGAGVMCWGDNLYGQLGNGWDPSQETPVAVVPEPARLLALASGGVLLAALARRRSRAVRGAPVIQPSS